MALFFYGFGFRCFRCLAWLDFAGHGLTGAGLVVWLGFVWLFFALLCAFCVFLSLPNVLAASAWLVWLAWLGLT